MQNQSMDPYRGRMVALRKILAQYPMDGILFSSPSNIRYLSGFDGSESILIVSGDQSVLLVDGRYTTQASNQVHLAISISRSANHIQGIKETTKALGIARLGFEAACVTVEFYHALREACPALEFVALAEEVRLLRAAKDKHEILTMKKAATMASEAVSEIISEMRPGWTELETALALEFKARQKGAQQVSFEPIIASGENAALPHAKPSHRKIRHGDFVVIDFGVRYCGYCSDETCTVAIGELTGDQKNAYRAVLRAHDEAIASLAAGINAADVDRAVRKALGKKFSRYFVHGTGHGVGLDVHEAPRLAPQSRDVLKAGMMVTIEPGLYYPGKWGVRIEDTVLVKKNGCEVITKMNKELIIIE